MERKRSPFAIPALIALAAVLALLVYGVFVQKGGNKYDNAVAEGKRLPAASRKARVLNTANQASVADFKGKVVLLNFWASWCEPCRTEAPAIERAYKKYKDQGLVVLGADVDDLSSKANAFRKEYGLTYPVLRYTRANATKDYGTKQIPETFVIDRQGRVVAVRRYQVDDKWLNSVIAPAIKEQQ